MRSEFLMLALQGGGALGALTWGVLDRLLEEPDVRIDAISGASAGAMNGAVLVHGWLEGGAAGARRALDDFWHAVAELAALTHWPQSLPGAPDWWPSAGRLLSGWTRQFAPAQFNPFELNPLRTLVAQRIDFDALRRRSPIRLLVAATVVRTGALRVFRDAELTVEHLLASACLPTLHHTVTIDGEAYWDGGYAGNPPLLPLVEVGRADDLLLVPLLARERPDVPRALDDIRARLAELHFNATLLRDLDALAEAQRHARGRWWDWSRGTRRLRRLRVHRLPTDAVLADLPVERALQADRAFLLRLRDEGRALAQQWLQRRR